MQLRRETSIGIAAILALQFIASMLAIGLLTRTGPVIDTIVQDNVRSEALVETMLSVVALHKGNEPTFNPTTGTLELSEVPPQFEEALKTAMENVTEDGESQLLEQVQLDMRAAFSGDRRAKEDLIETLKQIGASNRAGISKLQDKAKRLGEAGAWATAFIGTLSLALGIYAYRRLLLRIELPIQRILATMFRLRRGNIQARVNTGEAPAEISQMGAELNWLVDHWARPQRRAQQVQKEEASMTSLRRLLGELADLLDKPLVVHDAQGQTVVASKSALGVDTTGWIERPLIRTEYYLLTPPDEEVDRVKEAANDAELQTGEVDPLEQWQAFCKEQEAAEEELPDLDELPDEVEVEEESECEEEK